MKFKKGLAAVLGTAMLFSSVSVGYAEEEPYLLHVCYSVAGEAQPDLPLIQEKLNEITLKEINVQVELEAVSLFSASQTYALKASSQEKMDLIMMFPGYSYLASYANSGLIQPVEDYLEEYGSNITEVMGSMMNAGVYKGHQYAIVENRDVRQNANGFNVSLELCAKYDIDPDSITTMEDLEAAFAVIKENEPEVTVLMPETSGGTILYTLLDYYDGLGTGGGVLEVEEDGSLKVVNQLEQESYLEACRKVREWYEAGYISKDVLTSQEAGSSALYAGKCFAYAANSVGPKDDYAFRSIVLTDEKPIVSTQSDQMLLWGVSSTCEQPDKAVQFLNLCYGSAEIANLMMYGVEGTHYTILDDGTIDVSMNANWQNYWNMFGDYNKEYVNKDLLASMPGAENIEDYKRIMSEWETVESPAYGFIFDPTNVKTEIAACDAVNKEYDTVIGNGTVDPETELPKWIDKLYDAGLQKVIDEKQAQLDEWTAAQN